MIFETLFQNDYGADLWLPSPQEGFPFNIPEGATAVFRSTDPHGVFSRYEKIIFLRGKEEYVQSTEDPGLTRRKLRWKGLKCITRKNWEEPKKAWPQIWMINQSDVPLQVIIPDMLNPQRKVMLFWDLPTLVDVPCYSSFAPYKKYVMGSPSQQQKQMPGSIPGSSFDFLENNKLESKRSPQELERLKRMLATWKEEQKSAIRLM